MKRECNPGVPPPAPLPDPEVIDTEDVFQSWKDGKIDLVCVLGPTASGKTAYAVNLCREFDRLAGKKVSEIISADSRQVYRGMTIGTGKDLEDYGTGADAVPYHLIDIVDAGQRYDLYNYQQDFEKVYSDIRSRGGLPVLCGGTGLYIQAVTNAYSLPAVPPDPELRAKLEEADIEELREAYAERSEVDPEVMASKRRLIRALEVILGSGGKPAERSSFLPKETYFIGTLVDREERNRMIDRRLDARLQGGLVEEVRSLLGVDEAGCKVAETGISAEDLFYYGLEYRYVTQYVVGMITYDQMRSLLGNAIHQFAKRQMTFFRGMERKGTVIHWTEPGL